MTGLFVGFVHMRNLKHLFVSPTARREIEGVLRMHHGVSKIGHPVGFPLANIQ